MFMGPLEMSTPWNPEDLPGVHRFLHRTWRLVVPDGESGEVPPVHPHLLADRAPDPDVERALHRTIAKVGDDIEKMAFNTAVAAMMIFVNAATKAGERLARSQVERFLLVLSPFAPHLCEELWERLGHSATLAYEGWPSFDPAMLVEEEVELAVQVNGKIRVRIRASADATEEALLAQAREAAAAALAGKTIVKEVVVPGRLVNFVVR
jgi:leucyl-tRNA synthetase